MGLSHTLIADIFEISRASITQINSGSTWADVIPYTGKNLIFELDNKEWAGKKIVLIGKNGESIKSWDSIKEAGRHLNLDPSLIGKVARGTHKSYKGYVFKFADSLTREELEVKL